MRMVATPGSGDYSISCRHQFHFERHFPPGAGLCDRGCRTNKHADLLMEHDKTPAHSCLGVLSCIFSESGNNFAEDLLLSVMLAAERSSSWSCASVPAPRVQLPIARTHAACC